jgi:hypothetical protein
MLILQKPKNWARIRAAEIDFSIRGQRGPGYPTY